MMKNLTAKMYEKMTPAELARTAYSALAEGDEGEYLKIVSSVPRYDYNVPDIHFTHTFNSIYSMVHIWGTEYWRLMYVNGVSDVLSSHLDVDEEKRHQLRKQSAKAYQELLAHTAAMQQVCRDYDIPLSAVARLTGAQFDNLEPADEVLKEQSYGILKGMLLAMKDSLSRQEVSVDSLQ